MIDYAHLTEKEKSEIHRLFKGWKDEYLKSMVFSRRKDGWIARDVKLKATCYLKWRNT